MTKTEQLLLDEEVLEAVIDYLYATASEDVRTFFNNELDKKEKDPNLRIRAIKNQFSKNPALREYIAAKFRELGFIPVQ